MKYKWSRHIVLLAFLCIPAEIFSQEDNAGRSIELVMESIVENLGEEADAALIVEDLEELIENPLNINSATAEDLSRLHLLNDIRIQNLLNYVKTYGPVYSLYELNTVDGFTPDLLLQLEPFIRFGEMESPGFTESVKYGRHQLLLRTQRVVQKPEGYFEKEDGNIPYEGSRDRIYSRYRFEAGEKISAGITAEKDPGEAFFRGSNKKGFDFYSGHVSLGTRTVIENITVGDFVIRSGQGLVLWQGYSTGKSLNTLNISKTSRGSRPFTSTDENLFFRGASANLKFGNVRFNLFYSRKSDDANLALSDTAGFCFTSLQTSGYHRTQNETADEKSVRHTNTGGAATWNFRYLKIGTTVLFSKFEMPFVRSDQLYNRYRFSGTQNFNAGADYLFSKGKYQWFGEAAYSKSGGWAFLQGMVIHLHDRIGFSALFRSFERDYQALWAGAFSESGAVANETGLYLGTRILPFKYVTLHAYSDFHHARWISYSTAGPSNGYDIFAQADVAFSEKISFYLRCKNEVKDQKFTIGERYENIPERTQKSRIHFQFQPLDNLTLKTRFEHVLCQGLEKEQGFMVFQDVQTAPAKMPVTLSARLAWFSTQSYNTRIYAYENDILYAFSIPAYFGKGFRTYLNLRYQISNSLDFWLKIANTYRSDTEILGSGYDEIAGHHKTELKFQIRLKI